MQVSFFLDNELSTEQVAGRLAKQCQTSTVLYLRGDLGVGKTTFSRGFLRALGYQGRVKSPTYTLVEPYEIGPWRVFHFDLYRLADPEELEFIGIRDYFADNCLCLVEWPDKGAGLLAAADLTISIEFKQPGRALTVQAETAIGRSILEAI